jgi:hypothetical protein
MAPVTLSKIATITVGAAGAASINFTNIPQIYTDLKIVMSARTTYNAPTGQYISFNGSTSNFSNKYLFSDGSGASTGSIARYAGTVMGNATASVFNNTEIYITGYTSSNYKPFSVDNVAENNATYGAINIISGLWSDSAAITSISIAPDNGSYPQYSTATLYGIKSLERSAYASGGEVSEIGGYYIHTFKGNGTFTPTVPLTVEYLVVAGGGGGGGPGVSGGGGGGAGGVRCTTGQTGGGGTLESPLSLSSGVNYTVTVGSGGAANNPGSNSSFGSIEAIGGGRGKDSSTGANSTGGSGGGANGTIGGGGASNTTGASGTTNQGYAGGNGFPGPGDNARNSGGGGGAGGPGGNADASNGGIGGAGITSSISGASTVYGGGGGGGVGYGTRGTGTNGGGNGGNGSTAGVAGIANTGSGGGGGGRNESTGTTQVAGAGGSGIVIIRYPR